MAKFLRNFIAGRMNKVIDQRLLPEGEYIDAMNVRMGSTEKSEIGVIENTKGNTVLTQLRYIDGTQLSINAKCIGAIEDSAHENIYWFVHDPAFTVGATGKLDMILSYNMLTGILTYHVISIDDGGGIDTILNFNDLYLITGVNIIGDLLFFTDDYNPPRFINTTRNYPNPIGDIDEITAEQLMVIKRPPIQSPTISLINTGGQSNYLETRFISFAYRYRYIDGEYSATSQWSEIAFSPNNFQFSPTSFLNEGMTNAFNTVNVTYDTGSDLVVGIDLLFKQSNNNIIKVIDTFDKAQLGIPDYSSRTYTFSNSKIFTILSEAELLRLYDNVPRFAEAQTIMGNRLMYGNYVEGYNLIDHNGNPTKLEYTTTLITETIGETNVPTNLTVGNYNLYGAASINDSIVNIDLTGLALIAGSSITLDFRIIHNSWGGDTPFPSSSNGNLDISFTYFLQQNYASVYALASSVEFQDAIGTALNIKPVYSPVVGVETSCDGVTLTDRVNCAILDLPTATKYASGISSLGQPIAIITSPLSQSIGFQIIAMQFVDSITAPTKYYYEYYKIVFADASYEKISTPKSLHSNRGYQIGIVYMDEFNRSSTALVSNLNDTVHVPCGFSVYQNSIQVSIPVTQIAPYWASRYKFVIKPDAENYETIYSNIFFTDSNTNATYFLLEGENIRKVEVGDRYIVKADTNGAMPNCEYATVLEKESKSSNFIIPVTGGTVPAGVYMKMKPTNFSIVTPPYSYITYGTITVVAPRVDGGTFRRLDYPMNIADPNNPGQYLDYTVPSGSKIITSFWWDRTGTGRSCERMHYEIAKTYISSSDYDNMYDWFIGDNIAATLNQGYSDGFSAPVFNATLGVGANNLPGDRGYGNMRFFRSAPIGPGDDGKLILGFTTGYSCGGINHPGNRSFGLDIRIEVYRATTLLVFETEPTDALPDVFFENNLSFEIDSDGNHMGNVQNQDIATNIPAIIDTEFFNCFAFGNGVESFKIRDSIIGRPFNLGQRVNTVAAQEYKEADRFADITYSGIYNAETNVNRLNQFNLGLLNYKNLETSFGVIYKMDGRETDILVLQEDKISYVLAGKNLLSDSAAGGAITSVPEVLGTQIARTEKYGISFNPESYVQWGANRYFTDVKRGAVIQLVGDSYSNEQIKVISESNMRTWFRDMFNTSFNTQKLGGFDPYMNEYVLTTNDVLLPSNPQCLACGVTQTLSLSEAFTYCVDVNAIVGETTISWTVISNTGGHFTVDIEYNGTTYSSGNTEDDGQITFYKDIISIEIATVTITPTEGNLVLDVTVECPVPEVLTIVEIVVGNNSESGESIHTQYRYTNGTFISALQSNLVTLVSGTVNPLVSRYNVTTGYAGTGGFPPEFSTMSLQTNQIFPDDFVFDTLNDKFRYLRSNVLYPNIPASIQTVISLSHIAAPITGSGPVYSANFTVPDKTLGDVLYLIWDFRDSIPLELCYADSKGVDPQKEVCCNCVECTTDCMNITVTNISATDIAVVSFGSDQGGECSYGHPFSLYLEPSEIFNLCVDTGTDYYVEEGNATVTITECANCSTYTYVNPISSGYTASIGWKTCDGNDDTGDIAAGETFTFCVLYGTIPDIYVGVRGNMYLTSQCKCCADNRCMQWGVFDVTVTASIAWVNCDLQEVNQTFEVGGEEVYICVKDGFIPNIYNGACQIIPHDACIDSTKCP